MIYWKFNSHRSDSDLFLFVSCSPWIASMSGCMSQSQALSFSLFSFVSIKYLTPDWNREILIP